MLMNIFYNYEEEQWQSDCVQRLLFGKNLLPIPFGKQTNSHQFTMRMQNKKIGPLIGILTSKENRSDFYGNRASFKKIQEYLQKQGGISFVMTPEGFLGQLVKGYIYDQGEWRKAIFPLPDVIYNRVASYKVDQQLGPIRKIAAQNAIPFYNPHFFEKWETFKQLYGVNSLRKYLPKTEVLSSIEQLEFWLNEQQSVFVKLVLSNRGNGIYLITKLAQNLYELKANGWRKTYKQIDKLWAMLMQKLAQKKAVIQEKVFLKQYNNLPYDLRILVQRHQENWNITGIGVRCAGKDSITTHVPQGGQILSFDMISNDLNLKEIKFLTTQIALRLELAYGYLCEFSVDLGVDEANNFWILEVNSKPMKFDEAHIQANALHSLIECFYEDTGFKKKIKA